ncbi:MAG: hypothetical protein R3E95_03065 [Thiolinea sp.]
MNFLDKRNTDEELSQAKARLVFATVSPLYLAIAYFINGKQVTEHPIYVFGILGLIFTYSLLLRLWLRKPRDFLPARQWISVIHDLGGISLIMYETGQWGLHFTHFIFG